MKYSQLKVSKNTKKMRVGRGISAGRGKTAGRGTKGQGARTGGGVRPGFEGGQNPLMQRLPKLRGFKSKRTASQVVYTGQLQAVGKTINPTTLVAAGLINSEYDNVKIILKGEVKDKFEVQVQAISQSALDAIQKAGGTFKKIDRLKRSSKKTDK
jgi:large subunit ribosomal protein L15